MKHSIEELLAVVYRHYPRGIQSEDPRYEDSEEHRRLVAARRAAGAASEPWRALLRRLNERFPECGAQNGSLHLPTGACDAGYCGGLYRRTTPHGEHHHSVEFRVSFLVPYYLVYGFRVVDDTVEEAAGDGPPVWFDANGCYIGAKLEGTGDSAELQPARWTRSSKRRIERWFAPRADDQGYWDALVAEIEATFGCEPMPLDLARTVVPGVMTGLRWFGQATLGDCLMSHSW
jgi:hypothetical protein